MRTETIYKGATRPAMKLGIPLVPLVLMFGTGMLLMVWGTVLFSGWVAAIVLIVLLPVFGWMRYVTARDDQRLRQMFMAATLRSHDRNHRLWRSRSYAPTVYRGASDAWHD